LQKTRVVYCKDDKRKQNYPEQKFDFLGYTFRPRKAKSRNGSFFVSFVPAISNEAVKSIRSTIRQWHFTWRTDKSLEDLSHMFNPVIRGWINYYGSFYKSALYSTFQHFDHILARWASRKYKRLRGRNRRACQWVRRISKHQPWLFAHWQLLQSAAGQ
jgi:RNA-directed DNA polymerase